jgi:hypothetical protein
LAAKKAELVAANKKAEDEVAATEEAPAEMPVAE